MTNFVRLNYLICKIVEKPEIVEDLGVTNHSTIVRFYCTENTYSIRWLSYQFHTGTTTAAPTVPRKTFKYLSHLFSLNFKHIFFSFFFSKSDVQI